MTLAEKKFLTSGEVAELLGLTREALFKAEREGRLRPARREFGSGTRLYTEDDLEEIRQRLAR